MQYFLNLIFHQSSLQPLKAALMVKLFIRKIPGEIYLIFYSFALYLSLKLKNLSINHVQVAKESGRSGLKISKQL